MPIALTDSQLDVIVQHAEPLQPIDRDQYLRRVAALLDGQTIGDGVVGRACAQAQAELFKAPDLGAGVGTPKPLRRFSQRPRAPSAA